MPIERCALKLVHEDDTCFAPSSSRSLKVGHQPVAKSEIHHVAPLAQGASDQFKSLQPTCIRS